MLMFYKLGSDILLVLLFQAELCFLGYWQETLKTVYVGDDLVVLFSFPSSCSLR